VQKNGYLNIHEETDRPPFFTQFQLLKEQHKC